MAEIIFFVWLSITPYNSYKIPDVDVIYYTKKCNAAEGSLHFVRSTPRIYRFRFGDKKVEKWIWSGYNVYCYKIEEK